jgi:hypothetical protein
MKKKQPEIKNPFYLNHRFQKNDGQWSEWNKAIGQFTDIETAQKAIRLLKMTKPNNAMEIEFIHQGKKLDFNGNEINKSIIYQRK